jgi:hypothetical protein
MKPQLPGGRMRGFGWKRRLALTTIIFAIGSAAQDGRVVGPLPGSRSEKKVERWAQRHENMIQIHPTDATFEVPEAWQSPKTFFWLTRDALHTKGSRDWIGLRIADGSLPLDDCAAQINPDNLNWMRAYVVDSTEQDVLTRIREKGWKAARKIPNYMPGLSGSFQTVPAKEGLWTHVDIPYGLDFGDYTGAGYVSFYLRTVGGRELVAVFGHFAAGHETPDQRQVLLKSVVVPSEP